MSTHNIRFYGELTKIILQLSPNTLLVSSTASICKNNGTDQPAQLDYSTFVICCLDSMSSVMRKPAYDICIHAVISIFVVCCLDSTIPILAKSITSRL